MMSSPKLVTMMCRPIDSPRTRPRNCAICVSVGRVLSSTSTLAFLLLASLRMSNRVGTRVPRYCLPNQLPASSARIWSRVSADTAPVPLVVRSTVSSCMRTGTSPLVKRTSSSNRRTPAASALANAG